MIGEMYCGWLNAKTQKNGGADLRAVAFSHSNGERSKSTWSMVLARWCARSLDSASVPYGKRKLSAPCSGEPTLTLVFACETETPPKKETYLAPRWHRLRMEVQTNQHHSQQRFKG